MEWKGVMPAITTKFTDSDKLDINLFNKNLDFQLKSGVDAIALPPSDLNVDEVKTVEIQEVEVELEEMKKSMDKD